MVYSDAQEKLIHEKKPEVKNLMSDFLEVYVLTTGPFLLQRICIFVRYRI